MTLTIGWRVGGEQISMKEQKLFYLGKFGETIELSENKEMIKEAELFSTGIHRGVEYTEDDLNELVDNFNASEEVPIQLDHSESARDTVGYLQEVSLKDGKLLGKVKVIDEYAQDRINKGLMKKLSVSFYLKLTEEGFKPYKLREVSLVAFPQVKSARLFSENGYVSDYEEQGGNEMSQINLAELKAEIRKELETDIHAQYAELEAKIVKLEGVETKFNESQITSKVEKFQADNKVIPAQADSLTKLLASFNEEQMSMFDEFMKNNKIADFSEQGEVEQHDGEEQEQGEEVSEFDKFYDKHVEKYGKSL